MKPIERINLYLQFKSISPHSFEKRIGLSNGYFSKQLRNLGSVGSDILIKIDEYYAELNILWVLNGQGQMISTLDVYQTLGQTMQVDEYISKYEAENKKMKNLNEIKYNRVKSFCMKLSLIIKQGWFKKLLTINKPLLAPNGLIGYEKRSYEIKIKRSHYLVAPFL